MNLWPHQLKTLADVDKAIKGGFRRILVTTPTGGGKTRTMMHLIDQWTAAGLRTVLYTNRKMLVEQTSRVMEKFGIDFGVRAAGYKTESYFPVQISSLQTESSRVFKKGTWALHDADRVLIDEAHLQKAETARKVLDRHKEEGASLVGFTATPFDLGDMYDVLLCEGTASELRACGALIPVLHYGPDEPDMRRLKVAEGEDLSEKQAASVMMMPGLFGRVLEWFNKLNPDRKPSILFGPDVAGSVWFAEQFTAAGIPAAHIDGDAVWFGGEWEKSSKVARDRVLEGSRNGTIKVICNRFVMREGVDAPWLAHGIFATVFGAIQSYLQAGGRLLRAFPGMDHVTIQDHGGNWWRHGSLNDDRTWELGQIGTVTVSKRFDRLRLKRCIRCGEELAGEKTCLWCGALNTGEPYRCPQCAEIVFSSKCRCGFEVPVGRRSRPVVQTDGNLVEMHGDIFSPKRVSRKPDAREIWKRMYFRSRNSDRTFRAAFALYAYENEWGWPDRSWPFMPMLEADFYRAVKDVPQERLIK